MCKPGKVRVEKVWAQLTNPVINSLTQFDFHVDVVVIVDTIFFVGHHVDHLVRHHVGHLVYYMSATAILFQCFVRAQRRC